MNSTIRRVPTGVFLNLLFCATLASAQLITATVSGTIVDESGAVLPGASVTVKNLETGATRTVPTELNGEYRVTGLPIGEYAVRAEMSGFQAAVQRGIRLTTGREATV